MEALQVRLLINIRNDTEKSIKKRLTKLVRKMEERLKVQSFKEYLRFKDYATKITVHCGIMTKIVYSCKQHLSYTQL